MALRVPAAPTKSDGLCDKLEGMGLELWLRLVLVFRVRVGVRFALTLAHKK